MKRNILLLLIFILILTLGLGFLTGCGTTGTAEQSELTVSYGLVQSVKGDVLRLSMALDTSAESTDDWQYALVPDELSFDGNTEFVDLEGQTIAADELKIYQLLQLESDVDRLVRATVIGKGPEGPGCCE